MKNLSFAMAMLLAFGLAASSQTPQPTPPAPRPNDDEIVRITTNLVQIDVTVTDGKGNIVNDLRSDEVEIYEDGKRQTVSNFAYFALAPDAAPTTTPTPAKGQIAPPAPPVRLRPEQVQRTIALVVDDLGLSFESTYFVREALKKFVREQMQPGDLVAIIRTAGGMGALQQFTSDKRQLYAAIERVKWYPNGRGGISAFAPIASDPTNEAENALQQARAARGDNDKNDNGRKLSEVEKDLETFRSEIFAVGTLGAINYIVRGLRELPGRKSVVLMSEGFPLFSESNTENTRVVTALRRLTDLANRASVVIYTMDARGLQTLSLTAQDDVGNLTREQLEGQLNARRDALFESQSSLQYLAQETGGFAIRNSNDLNAGLRRILNDQRGYYLIGYRPDEATFDATGRRTFHKISVKVTRPGLKARTRTGFFGISEEKAVPVRATRFQQMTAALSSPFGAGGVTLRLTCFFSNEAQLGSYVHSLLHIDANDLTFVKQPDGKHQATFDVLAYTFGDNGVPLDSLSRTYTMTVNNDADLAKLRTDGFIYTITVPIKKAGAYQLRLALRDTATERTGAVSQFIETPDLKKDRLALSGLIVQAGLPVNAQDKSLPANALNGDAAGVTQGSPAVRRFRQGQTLDYGYRIFNAKLDKTTRYPQLTTQIRVYRDGREVYAGTPRPFAFDPTEQPDAKRLGIAGGLRLGAEMVPGEYLLQVIVTDALASEKRRTVTQWIDFEIVK